MLTQLAASVAVSLCNHLTLHFHHQNPCPASRVCRRTRLYAPPPDGQETCHSILGGNDANVPGLPASTSATARLCHGRGQCQRQCLGIVAHDDLHAPGQIAASIKRHYKQIQSAASSDAVARRTSPGQSLRTGPGAGRGGATSSVLGKVRRMCNLCATARSANDNGHRLRLYPAIRVHLNRTSVHPPAPPLPVPDHVRMSTFTLTGGAFAIS